MELGTQFLEAQEVGVESPAAYLVAARLSDDGFAEASQQRTYHQHRAAQLGTLAHELVALQVVEVQLIGLEGVRVDSG